MGLPGFVQSKTPAQVVSESPKQAPEEGTTSWVWKLSATAGEMICGKSCGMPALVCPQEDFQNTLRSSRTLYLHNEWN